MIEAMTFGKTSASALVICALLITFILVTYTSWPLETSLPGYLVPNDEYYLKIEAILNEVIVDVAKIRMLDKPNSVEFRVVTLDWVKENWGRRSVEANIREVNIEEEIYKAVFLIPEDFSFSESKVQQAGYIMAALAGDTLYFTREHFDSYNEEGARETVAHEIAHLLQTINFNIEEPTEFDAKQAKNALIEGDAEVTKAEYLLLRLNRTVERSSLPSGNRTLTESEALWLLWVAPGIYGIGFVETLYEEGGWDKVDEALDHLPISMEQIMHPEKYLAGEGIVDFELRTIGEWELRKSDRFGELFILLVLARHIPVDEAKFAAEGWAGDKFSYYRKSKDQLFLWKIFWDSSVDRDEFLAALGKMLRSVESEEIALCYWKTYNGYLIVEPSDLSVTIVGASEVAALRPLHQSNGTFTVP
ncbi:MAG: hypothetical protein ACETV1_04220 [Candidatus Bathyarchaeia archaeon]